ncbi:MAG TPA: trypsin-like peptidase domain-containing protein [Myxococcales bacterium]|jgi:S1-C subfamily serine protease|nr:trypsin-like peptidase domain-containing protein [Myxococcales bacterium]
MRIGHARLAGGVATALALAFAGAAAADRPSSARRTPLVQAVDHTRPAVVNINAQEVVKARAPEDAFELFFGGGRMRDQVRTSLGSGFVFDAGGYVLTNYHVVARGTRIQVSFEDGSDYTAKVVGTDPGGDLAVLKIQSNKKFPSSPLGTSSDLMLGEPAIAIGNPFGLNQSVSVGVVSALHRTVRAENRSYYDFIQTDASINPGNSGGPLINADGEVIGVCSAIYANAQGIGFAIPIDRALRVARELVRSGELAASFWGFDASTPEGKPGAKVDSVENGSPAAHAGLRRGDVVVSVDRSPVRDADELRFLLHDVPLGARVTLGILRDGEKHEVALSPAPLTPERAMASFESATGLKLAEFSADEARKAGIDAPRGLVAIDQVKRGSAAQRGGLRAGDIVVAVNSAEVDTLKDFQKALGNARKSGRAVLLVQRGYRLMEFPVDVG